MKTNNDDMRASKMMAERRLKNKVTPKNNTTLHKR